MTNEWNEFRAYTQPPTYAVSGGKDTSFLGRFTSDMIREFSGLSRIFKVLARGYIFHNSDGSIKGGDPYGRIEYARRALCAWCSIPKRKKATPAKEWQFDVCFAKYYEEFPELTDETGAGWYWRHIHAVADFVRANKASVNRHLHCLAERTAEWEAEWEKKVKQFQVPLFSVNTNAEWLLLFDTAIADALELGPLCREALELSPEQIAKIEQMKPDGVPLKVMLTLAEYYIANKPADGGFIVLPVTNMEAYLGSSALGKQYLSKMPREFMERKETGFGICMYKVDS